MFAGFCQIKLGRFSIAEEEAISLGRSIEGVALICKQIKKIISYNPSIKFKYDTISSQSLDRTTTTNKIDM